MHSILKLQLVLVGLLWLGAIVSAQNNQFSELPIEDARKALTGSCKKNEDCIKNSECKHEKCLCKDKYYPDQARTNCVDKPSDPHIIAQQKQNRTLTVQCQSGSQQQQGEACPKNSACTAGYCLCEEGFVHSEDSKTCIAGAVMTATLSIVPVFISTAIYLFRSFN
jgi:hypothetical protein